MFPFTISDMGEITEKKFKIYFRLQFYKEKSAITSINHHHIDHPLQNKSDTESDYGSDGSVYNVGKYSSRLAILKQRFFKLSCCKKNISIISGEVVQ